MTKEIEFYNFVIVGGGPAGLTASIVAARNGFKAVVLEKSNVAGPKPRGEGISIYPLLDEILGKDFLQSIGFRSSVASTWHSPGDLQQTKTPRTRPHYFFKWRDYIDRLVDLARELGVVILLKSEVIEPIEKDNMCVGVKYKDENGKIQEIHGNAIFGCDGHESVIGKHYNIPYDTQINCPIVKCLVSNANIDINKTPNLQFYFIGNGDLEYAPSFPQCVVYVFPLGKKEIEVGLMLRLNRVHKMKKTVKIPSNSEIMEVWQNLKQDYPGFSDFFKGANIDYEELTALSNIRMVKNYIPTAGIILIGDSAGFVDPFGSSGLIYSMEAAKFWANILFTKINELSGGKTEVTNHLEELWSSENIEKYKKKWENNPIFKHIKKSYGLIGKFEWYIFKHLRTSERINKKWKLISRLLKMPEK